MGRKLDERLRHQVRLHPDRGLNPGLGEPILEVGVVIQEDRGAKWHLLRPGRADRLFDVIAAQRLGRTAFFHHQHERVIFVGHDLLVFEQLEETVIGNVFDIRVGAAAEKNREADEGEGDGDQDDSAPVKTGLAAARFVLLLGVAIRLRHKAWSARWASAKTLT